MALLHGQAAAQGLIQEGGVELAQVPLLDALVGIVHVDAAAVDQVGGGGGQGPCGDGADLVIGEDTVGLHDAAQGHLGHLSPVGQVDIGHDGLHAEECFHQVHGLLGGAFQGEGLSALGKFDGLRHPFGLLLLPEVHGGQPELPVLHGLRVLQIPQVGDKLRQMPVAGGGQGTVFAEQVQLQLVAIGEGVVAEGEAVIALVIALLIKTVHELRQQLQQVHVLILRLGDPGEMVDAAGIGVNIPPGGLDAPQLLQHAAQQLLGVEDLMAAAEGLDAGEHIVEGLDADAHGVGEVQHPGIGADVPNLPGELLVNGHGPHGPQHAAGTGGVAHGLVYAVLLRGVDIAAHLPEGAGEDGDDDEIRAQKGFI